MSEALVELDADFLQDTGLDMEDAMVFLQGDVLLVVNNLQNTHEHLEDGQLLG